jgi:hypothetical protein
MTEQKINAAGILAKKAMIVTLNISSWSARKTDKLVTSELADSKKTEKEWVRVSKTIIDKAALTQIKEIAAKMRKYHNTVTLPWNNDGGRLLPTTKHSEYTAFYRKCSQEFEDAVTDFLKDYQNHVSEASYHLNDMYNSDDYPDIVEIRDKFCMELSFDKVPEASDFRVDIPEYEQEKIAKQIEDRVEQQHAESMRRVWNRVYKTVEHVYDRLKDENAIFRNSMITNVQELVDLLPDLNILKDPNLEDMSNELKQTLCQQDPDELRRNKIQRKQVADESRGLLDKIGQYFNTSTKETSDIDENTDTESDEESEDSTEENLEEVA